MSRLHKTLADYVVIAISPALIMALVGSLVFFLLRVFYQGEFQGRLHWVMMCFVFASVLISRIAIEEGFERAAPFGVALAIVVGLAANKFIEVQGTWADSYGWVVNFALIAIIWWCAHKLTWDCTVIDQREDASGEGLMQAAGLERLRDAGETTSSDGLNLEGTTGREVPAGYWQRYVEHQRRPHAPGVWVVYFSLAALPLFGIGQWFIPASDVGGRRYVFWLLCLYVTSGLALLVTTSFLGLRRYLRQRRIEMPTLMANLWLTTGVAIILLLLAAAALLPRPSAEYDVAELGVRFASPDQDASQYAPSRQDGTQDDQGPAAARENASDSPETEEPQGGGNEPGGQSDDSGGSATTEPSASKSSQSGGQSSAGDSQGQQGQQSQSGQQGKSRQQDPSSQQPPSERPSQSNQQSPAQPDGTGKPGEAEPNRDGDSGLARKLREYRDTQRELAKDYEDKKPERSEERPQDDSSGDNSVSPPSTQTIIEPLVSPLASLIRMLQKAFFVLFVLFVLWHYRDQVLAVLRGMLDALREFWAGLFGGRRRDFGLAADEAPRIIAPRLPFAAYADPFASGLAARATPAELVIYSFEAFEAWAAEHGCPRGVEQTPHELARDVKRLNAAVGPHGRALAELYACAAYSRGELPPNTLEQLQSLWRQMQTNSGIRAVLAEELQAWS
jgi:hypothetical protein